MVERDIGAAKLTIFLGAEPYDINDSNVDIEVALADGRRLGATLFTLANIGKLMRSYEASGECDHGSYFWCKDLVVVRDLSVPSIEELVRSLLRTGEIGEVFQLLE